ncbi:MAG: DUF3793 family protein [Clostridia bacterium]|nr:DUF3793 family protein [Clostridia bacterium]
MTISEAIIEYCSPTLAGIKVGSLFGLTPEDPVTFCQEAEAISRSFEEKGIRLDLIPSANGRYLCYLYRPAQLQLLLSSPEIRAFLTEQDYNEDTPILPCLYQRLSIHEEFPHEIGIFLGYPLSDVKAFIENRGYNCLCCGCWKVYSNVADARAQFDRCKKCTRQYKLMFRNGYTIQDLAVAA